MEKINKNNNDKNKKIKEESMKRMIEKKEENEARFSPPNKQCWCRL